MSAVYFYLYVYFLQTGVNNFFLCVIVTRIRKQLLLPGNFCDRTVIPTITDSVSQCVKNHVTLQARAQYDHVIQYTRSGIVKYSPVKLQQGIIHVKIFTFIIQ